MEIKIFENIKKMRKEHDLTQEQLAEALCVTVGAVYKWESGKSVPEVGMLIQLANLFEVSLDALVGFEVRDSGSDALEKRIRELQLNKAYSQAVEEAEKALVRYPNNFRIVYRCGELYAVAGTEQKNEKYLYRCIELLNRSTLLISQNENPEISETLIQNEIAQCYIMLGKHEKGIEILKKYNICGVHDALIAITYSGESKFDPKEAEPYMASAFSNIITSSIRTMMAYANYYFRIKNYAASRESLLWLIDLLEKAKSDKDSVAYVDKIIAPCNSECANLSLLLGEQEKAEYYLVRAYSVAKKFDTNPTFKFDNIKFLIGKKKDSVAYDDFGNSATEAVVKQITQDDRSPLLYEIWKKISSAKTEVI